VTPQSMSWMATMDRSQGSCPAGSSLAATNIP
jgi:hypothetical protein